jgi:hypothetical protein
MATHRPIAAKTTQAVNGAWYPCVRTAGCDEVPARETITLVTIAVPNAAPVWKAAVLIPEAAPASSLLAAGQRGRDGRDWPPADAKAQEQKAREEATEVAAVRRGVGEQERSDSHEHHAGGRYRAKTSLNYGCLRGVRAENGQHGQDGGGEAELERGVAQHFLCVA